MDYTAIIYEKVGQRGRVAQITLNRPDKMNSLSEDLSRDLYAALDEANKDDEIRAIVLTGAGRAFCAGANLGMGREAGVVEREGTYSGMDLVGWYNNTERGLERTHWMHKLHKPIVAALNGYTLGAGFELAITCDLLIASEQAVLGAPEIRHGSIVATWLPFIIGPMWAKRLILTGDHITAQRAKDIGLVLDVVPHDQLIETAVALADRIAMVPPLAVRLNKRMLDGVVEMMGLEKGLAYGELISAITHVLASRAETADGRSLQEIRATGGIRAFLEARDGPFGRTPW